MGKAKVHAEVRPCLEGPTCSFSEYVGRARIPMFVRALASRNGSSVQAKALPVPAHQGRRQGSNHAAIVRQVSTAVDSDA